ncbi:MAG: PfaD family polyunsaturated fatty acid/polyketide biosynthesis protein [Planctomycetota bacterium]|jgi:PfaD family protein|nr:PfaD family polyunsaturated fatty acid/polyketide biosynthesis protein [Planctomycetota bacterium]
MLSPVTQGWWISNGASPSTDLNAAVRQISEPLTVVNSNGQLAFGRDGISTLGGEDPGDGALPIKAYVPACPVEQFGDPSFCADHGIKYPCFAGAMANGISSADIVENMSKAGMLGFYGSAGLPPTKVEGEIDRIQSNLGDGPFGFNLIHSPNVRGLEDDIVDLYLRKGVKLVSASAYLGLTRAVVRYRVHGIHRDEQGRVVTPNRIIAKISRTEVATRFMSPPPEKFLKSLVESGDITSEQAEMAVEISMAQDFTAEADSGGHTDNRPAVALVPTMLALRDQMQAKFNYRQQLRVGAAGGISTPSSAAAAFAMGAAFIVTGSVNQACVESGSADRVRQMLAEAGQADITMAPAADMFEMGVKVQVLKRGTMFAMRGHKLYEIYRSCESIEDIPPADRAMLEKTVFKASLDEIWSQTREFFEGRDPSQIQRAEQDPKHKMSLVFRWYLGQSSRWANAGEPTRQIDYQVWCGPAMGAFNEWVKGSFLEEPANRKVVTVAMNILYGAAVMNRLHSLANQGVKLSTRIEPLPLEEIQVMVNG